MPPCKSNTGIGRFRIFRALAEVYKAAKAIHNAPATQNPLGYVMDIT
jgi:hypothetical protein